MHVYPRKDVHIQIQRVSVLPSTEHPNANTDMRAPDVTKWKMNEHVRAAGDGIRPSQFNISPYANKPSRSVPLPANATTHPPPPPP